MEFCFDKIFVGLIGFELQTSKFTVRWKIDFYWAQFWATCNQQINKKFNKINEICLKFKFCLHMNFCMLTENSAYTFM